MPTSCQIKWLVADKTGTLTCNEMRLKKVALNGVSYDLPALAAAPGGAELARALALAHSCEVERRPDGTPSYAAASPDEEALVLAAAQNGAQFLGRVGNTLTVGSHLSPDD